MSSEKKRKSHSGRAEDARPNKKPALESLLDLPPLKVSTIEDGSELAPVLGTSSGISIEARYEEKEKKKKEIQADHAQLTHPGWNFRGTSPH